MNHRDITAQELQFIKEKLVLRAEVKEQLIRYAQVVEHIEAKLPDKLKPVWQNIKTKGISLAAVLERLSSAPKTSPAHLIPLLIVLTRKQVVIRQGQNQGREAQFLVLAVIPDEKTYQINPDDEIDVSTDLGFYPNPERKGSPVFEVAFEYEYKGRIILFVALTMEFAAGPRTTPEHLAQAIAQGILRGAFGFSSQEAHQFVRILNSDPAKTTISLDELLAHQ